MKPIKVHVSEDTHSVDSKYYFKIDVVDALGLEPGNTYVLYAEPLDGAYCEHHEDKNGDFRASCCEKITLSCLNSMHCEYCGCKAVKS